MKKAILIIGATGGVGKLLCEEFKKNGYYVIGNGRRRELLEDMKKRGSIDDYIVGDLTNENDRKNIIEKIKDLNNLMLFYNLGILHEYPRNYKDYSEEQIIKSFEVNVLSIMKMDNELLKENIILDTIYMVSISAFYRGEWDYLYQITKSSLMSYIETLILDDIKNNRKREIIVLFPDTIKTGDEGMGTKLKEYEKIPGDIFAKEVINIINERKHIGYIFSIENGEINLYSINPDKETGRFEYNNKKFIKKLGRPVY